MFPYLEWTLTFLIIVWVFEGYLDYRQHQKYKERHLPNTLVGIISEEKFLKAQAYGLDKSWFGIISDCFSQVFSILVLKYHWMPWLWNVSGGIHILPRFISTKSEVKKKFYFFFSVLMFEK
jgi:STE24 endopeptidase